MSRTASEALSRGLNFLGEHAPRPPYNAMHYTRAQKSARTLRAPHSPTWPHKKKIHVCPPFLKPWVRPCVVITKAWTNYAEREVAIGIHKCTQCNRLSYTGNCTCIIHTQISLVEVLLLCVPLFLSISLSQVLC